MQLRVQRSSAVIFHKWNKKCFSSSAIVKDSKGKKVGDMSGARFYKNQHYVFMIWRKLDPVGKNCTHLLSHNKIKNIKYAKKN